MPDLDAHLDRSRTELLGEIDQPPIAAVRRRAGALRRRRRTAVAGSALAVIVVAGVVGLHPWDRRSDGTVNPAAPPSVRQSANIYTGSGITINGLQPNLLVDLPGQIADVEFVDPDHGYVVSQCTDVTVCTALSLTDDTGETFTRATLPEAARRPDLHVVVFPRGQAMLETPDASFMTADSGHTWQPVVRGGATQVGSATPDQILRLDGAHEVTVWDPVRGSLGPLASQPLDIDVVWVSARPAGNGAWWVGGVAPGGKPAAAVTRDGGRTWQERFLPGSDVRDVHVATLGTEVWAVATGEGESLRGIYHSTDGGATFAAVGHGGTGPAKISGDPVPLLDGRLLVAEPGLAAAKGGAGGRWWLSTDDGATFTTAASLPSVGRLAQTGAGYVAYELFAGSWAAYSADGSTWNKLQAN
ncbi:MAG TPA: hypothetical protein VI011_14835 [Asanoa sp.]